MTRHHRAVELGVPYLRPCYVEHEEERYQMFQSGCSGRTLFLNQAGQFLRPDEIHDLGLDIQWG